MMIYRSYYGGSDTSGLSEYCRVNKHYVKFKLKAFLFIYYKKKNIPSKNNSGIVFQTIYLIYYDAGIIC